MENKTQEPTIIKATALQKQMPSKIGQQVCAVIAGTKLHPPPLHVLPSRCGTYTRFI